MDLDAFAPCKEQALGMLRHLLSASGPISALVVGYGGDPNKTVLWLSLAAAVVTPVVSFIWSAVANSKAKQTTKAAAIPGVTVTVDRNVAPESVVKEAEKDTNNVKVTSQETK